jgi:hypothetical protein
VAAVFFTKALPVLLAALMLSFALPMSNAALLAAYDLVGEDPTGDARNYSAPGVDTGQFSTARTDIVSIEMANDGSVVQIKQNIGALPAGTGRYMYVVHFKVEGTSYFTCWNVAWIGGQANPPEAENTFGCSRFTGATQVGPATRAAGVQVATADGKNFVRWEVPKTAIKMGSADLPITDIVGETWFGGAANGSPSTSQSMYIWNQADRAPNTDAWAYSLAPKAPALSLNLSIEPNATAVGPGTAAQFAANVSLVGDGLAEVNFTLQGLPEGWSVAGLEDNLSLGGDNQSVLVNFTVMPPADASNQSVNLTLNATSLAAGVASVNLTILVDTSLLPPPPAATAKASSTPSPVGTPAAAPTTESDKIPGPGVMVLLIALAGTVALARRRQVRQ